jgi:hypothetical protein
MIDLKKFKPNLIPNTPKDGSYSRQDLQDTIDKNGGIENYIIFYKKDGCRMHLGLGPNILTRSLKQPQSELVIKRFQPLNDLCRELKIAIDGEFYMHGLKFNEIFRYFSNTDVTRQESIDSLTKEFSKNPHKFDKDYNHRTIGFLSTFHEDLKFWLFDGIVLDRPDLVGFAERMTEISERLSKFNLDELYLEVPYTLDNTHNLDLLFRVSLLDNWEGLVLTHKDHPYKYGRSTIKAGTILKLKDDTREYDGVILDVEEATEIKEGIEKTVNELGRSVTSKKKGDRVPSGLAKGFVVQFEDKGTFTVGLRGFDNEAKAELITNKEAYIGRHFKYSGMPPVKDFPRSVYFDCWRDEK